MTGFLSLILLFYTIYVLTKLLKPLSLVDKILQAYVSLIFLVLATGYMASLFHAFNNLFVWCGIQLAFVGIIYLFSIQSKTQHLFTLNFSLEKLALPSMDLMHKILLLVVGIIFCIQLFLIYYLPPHNADSLTYHLARTAFYIQHGSIEAFGANQWTQEVHPKNSSILFTYIFLVTKNENLTQVFQFLAYVSVGCIVYSICRKLGLKFKASILAALISYLPISLVMGSTTTQNDLLICSFAGLCLHFLLSLKLNFSYTSLTLLGLAFAIMIGFKASALMNIPILAIVGIIFIPWKDFLTKLTYKPYILVSIVMLTFLFISISGYYENFLAYGNAIGPEFMRKEHSFEGQPISFVLESGCINFLRYMTNFTTWDGFLHGPSFIYDLNSVQWKVNSWFLHRFVPSVYDTINVRLPYGDICKINADEEKVYFGPMGFMLFWPIAFFYLIYGLRSIFTQKMPYWPFLFSLLCIVYVFTQSLSGYYDPWRGRMFGPLVFFMAPLVGHAYASFQSLWLKIWYSLVLIIACSAAFWSIFCRDQRAWFIPNYTGKTIFEMDRMELMMSDLPYDYPIYAKIDNALPPHSKVVSSLLGSFPEYILFGKNLSRKVYTHKEFYSGKVNANYQIFIKNTIPSLPKDVEIESGFMIRKLNP